MMQHGDDDEVEENDDDDDAVSVVKLFEMGLGKAQKLVIREKVEEGGDG
jgi:hypothetical protein